MLVNMGTISPIFGLNIKNYLRNHHLVIFGEKETQHLTFNLQPSRHHIDDCTLTPLASAQTCACTEAYDHHGFTVPPI